MPLRVLDSQGVGNNWVLLEALRYALDPDGDPSTDDGAHVINMSLASVHKSGILRQIIGEACGDKGIESEDPTPVAPPAHPAVVAVAAGNQSSTLSMYPAAENAKGEISVGASSQSDALSAFSERGWPTVMAPGEGIVSSVPGGGTGTWAGTSMASPLVAGEAALVRASSPGLSPEDVVKRIHDTGVRPQPQQLIDRRVDAAAAVVPFANGTSSPVDATPDFVRQHYLDFLNRAPDASGLDFWSKGINDCAADAACVQVRRVNTSAAFFLSIEFQNTGYFVYRMYKTAFGNLAGKPVPVRYEDFMPDTQKIGEGVVVGQAGWEQKIEANQKAFALDFVTRQSLNGQNFGGAFPAGTGAGEIVGKMFTNAGVKPTDAERQSLLDELAPNPDSATLRADVLKKIAEHPSLVSQEKNRAFVLAQYFGYLRRNPDGGPDTDFTGYNFWLSKLEQFGGDFQKAEMVRAFIESAEYRARFGHF